MGSVKRRAYRSSIRRGDAPALVCEAAYRLFSTKGYLATSIEDIAAEAGVAVATVYKVFTNKATVLSEAVARAMAGADGRARVEDQPWWREQFTEPDPARQLRLIARNARRIYDRAAAILEVVRAAAPLDEGIATIRREWKSSPARTVVPPLSGCSAGLRDSSPCKILRPPRCAWMHRCGEAAARQVEELFRDGFAGRAADELASLELTAKFFRGLGEPSRAGEQCGRIGEHGPIMPAGVARRGSFLHAGW